MTNPIPLQTCDFPQPPHDRAAILAVGDELAIGQSLDTNSKWIAGRLTDLGIHIVEHRTLPDDLDGLIQTFRDLADRAALIIVTGGLGPTADDLTRDALAAVLDEPLVTDELGVRWLEAIAKRLGRTLNDNNRRQALRPPSARLLENDRGTAPGIAATIPPNASADTSARTPTDIYCLPGPPFEMTAMWERLVEPELRPPASSSVVTKLLHLFAVGESDAAATLGELMDRGRNPLVGTTASSGVITVRIRGEGNAGAMRDAVQRDTQRVRELFPNLIFAEDGVSLAERALQLLTERNHTLTLAESCTGGMLAAALTAIPGSSAAVLGSHVVYANETKTAALGVPAQLIAQHGAVSAPVAESLATSAREHAPAAHHALSITGIAGPSGGSNYKPVGTVYIARASAEPSPASPAIDIRRFHFPGDRERIRERACLTALAMLVFHLQGTQLPETIWQRPRDE